MDKISYNEFMASEYEKAGLSCLKPICRAWNSCDKITHHCDDRLRKLDMDGAKRRQGIYTDKCGDLSMSHDEWQVILNGSWSQKLELMKGGIDK